MPSKPLRKSVPRSTFRSWRPAADRRDPLELIHDAERGRIPALLTLRHERMSENAFGFYRGNAAVMAADLSAMPVTGMHVQLGGDAHLMNFGGYATPERRLVFDVNDFDETLAGPWEWDIARLVASLPLAAKYRKFPNRLGAGAALAAALAYRMRMRALAAMSPIDVWYSSVEVGGLLKTELTLPRDATHVKPTPELETLAHAALVHYRDTLQPHVRMLLDRYHLVETFEHPVGVGSLGLLVLIVRFESEQGQNLYLQFKGAVASVMEPYLKASPYANHGERCIQGQRLMQAATDIFVGWTREADVDLYVRQLRDEKASLNIDAITADQLVDFASRCGAVLARAHARTGNPQEIAAYLGSKDTFEKSFAEFALAYSEQVEKDYEAFRKQN
jgi:uncharacterized protein (DUF2252 family)